MSAKTHKELALRKNAGEFWECAALDHAHARQLPLLNISEAHLGGQLGSECSGVRVDEDVLHPEEPHHRLLLRFTDDTFDPELAATIDPSSVVNPARDAATP
ncbi:uncharacterized protein LOC735719 isoform X3 [Pan troglodytes]|uniref:uncharacterized protein LOC735719 isoform X3 n=1 Tax=Pan troglodytes TaxID=9598 RepID=UPI000511CFEA